MRLGFEEIWKAAEFIPQFFTRCRLDLYLGTYCFESMSEDMLQQLYAADSCDRELIPALFSERELFWQPDMQPSLSTWHTRLSGFLAFITQYTEALKVHNTPVDYLYAAVLHDLHTKAEHTRKTLAKYVDAPPHVHFHILMRFRLHAYPHVLFFLSHPHLPRITSAYAQNRLDLMLRTLLLEGKYSLRVFAKPCWEIQLNVQHTPAVDDKAKWDAKKN